MNQSTATAMQGATGFCGWRGWLLGLLVTFIAATAFALFASHLGSLKSADVIVVFGAASTLVVPPPCFAPAWITPTIFPTRSSAVIITTGGSGF